jgi:tetratricopeptide (TPR) repeat protein
MTRLYSFLIVTAYLTLLGQARADHTEDQALEIAKRFKECSDLFSKPDYSKAADCFAKIADEFPTFRDSDKALFNAAVAYEKSNRQPKAQEAFQRLVDRYPHSTLAGDSMYRVAVYFQAMARYEEAAQHYEKLVARTGGTYRCQEALQNAFVLRRALGHVELAAKNAKKFVKRFEKTEDGRRVLKLAADMQYKHGRLAKAAALYRQYFKMYKKLAQPTEILEVEVRLGNVMAGLGKKAEAKRLFKTALKRFSRLPPSRHKGSEEYAAEAAYRLAEFSRSEAPKIEIQGPYKHLAKRVEQRLDGYRKVNQTFENVLKYKSPKWAIAALASMGELVEELAAEFQSAPLPKSIPARHHEEYLRLLKEQGLPIEDRACKYYEKALQIAWQSCLLDEHVKRVIAGLNRIEPDKYALPEDPPDVNAVDQNLAKNRTGPKVEHLVLKALEYRQQKKWLLAEMICYEIFMRNPADKRILNLLGVVLFEKGSTARAFATFQQVANSQPDYLPAQRNLGAMHLRVLNGRAALAAYEKILKSHPQDTQALRGMALALEQAGR